MDSIDGKLIEVNEAKSVLSFLVCIIYPPLMVVNDGKLNEVNELKE